LVLPYARLQPRAFTKFTIITANDVPFVGRKIKILHLDPIFQKKSEFFANCRRNSENVEPEFKYGVIDDPLFTGHVTQKKT